MDVLVLPTETIVRHPSFKSHAVYTMRYESTIKPQRGTVCSKLRYQCTLLEVIMIQSICLCVIDSTTSVPRLRICNSTMNSDSGSIHVHSINCRSCICRQCASYNKQAACTLLQGPLLHFRRSAGTIVPSWNHGVSITTKHQLTPNSSSPPASFRTLFSSLSL
jgi:hypothetical protein